MELSPSGGKLWRLKYCIHGKEKRLGLVNGLVRDEDPHGNREVTVYLLTSLGKPKMTRAEDSERVGCKPNSNAPKLPGVSIMVCCRNTSMAELAQNLQQQASAYIDHPLVDATGLEGGWDYFIGWTPKAQLEAPQAPNANGETSPSSGISVFDAFERGLGLKLVGASVLSRDGCRSRG